MYKILVKRFNRNLFEPYMIEKTIDNTENGTDTLSSETIDIYGQKIKSNSDMIEYSTDDLEELARKYKKLLASYTIKQIRVIEDLDIEMIISVLDN